MTNQFIKNIYEFGKKYLGYKALASSIRLAVVLLIMWVSVSLADDLFYFSELTRWGLWFLNLAVIAYLVFNFAYKPLMAFFRLKKENDLTPVAKQIEKLFPEIRDDLVNGYQLITSPEIDWASEELKQAAVTQIVKKYQKYDFSKRIKFQSHLPEWRWLLLLGIGFSLLLVFRFKDVAHSTLRLLNPANSYARVPEFSFSVVPGDTTIIKGESIDIRVNYRGPALKNCYLLIKGKTQQHKTELSLNQGIYRTTLKNILRPLSYQIIGEPLIAKGIEGSLSSSVFRVNLVTLPMIHTLDITLNPPRYTQMGAVTLERNIGDISALMGTGVRIRAVSDKILAKAGIAFSWGDTLPLRVRDRIVTGGFTVRREGSYKFVLQDTAGYKNRNPIVYQISVLKDYPPLAEIVKPGEDIELPLDAQLPVTIEARDDFGISAIQLFYRIIKPHLTEDTLWQSINLKLLQPNEKQQSLTIILDFNEFPLAFGDQLKYYALAKDNNRINGPGIGKSRIYFVRFPSVEEIFQTVDDVQQEKVEDLKDVTKEAKELKKSLKQLERELKQSQKLDWEKKNQLAGDIERQKKLQKRIEKIQKELDEAIKKLEQNDLISEEVLKKYMKLQDLFREVITPQLEEALKKLNKALEKSVRPKDVERALKEFRLNQQAFEERIERTMELLKQVLLEQKMDELAKKAESLYKQQQKISKDIKKQDSLKAKDNANLEQRQKEQNKLFERLKYDIQETKKNPLMNKYPETLKKLDSLLTRMSAEDMKADMKRLQQNLKQGDFKQAGRQSQQLQKQFGQMSQSLRQAYQQMMNKGKRQIAQKMERAIQRLLELSAQQERVHKKTRKTSPLSDGFNQVIRDQGQLNSNLNKVISEITQLSKETFLIQPQMSKSLQNAARSMRKALQQLSDRYKNGGMQYQTKAMGALNRSIGQMMQSQQQLAGSSSGTGFEQFMQQLQQMAGKQGQLNNQTMDLFNSGNNGTFSLQQQQAMRRLAAQQAALKQALQKMSEEMGKQPNVLGRLGKVAEDMDEVVKDLLNKNLSRKTIERQQRILSRMLDAQKSIREREYSKKRQAERAKKYLARDPGQLKNLYDMDLKQLQDAMRKALEQGYNRDYQILIEAYFKRLLRNYQEQKR